MKRLFLLSLMNLVFILPQVSQAAFVPSSTLANVWYKDADGDGYGDAENKKIRLTRPTGYVSNKTDCDDTDASAYPGATEVWYNGTDNDCSGGGDYDQDGDGWGKNTYYFWDTEYTSYLRDCNDTDSSISPSATEIDGNAVDEDCDGESIIETYAEPVWACWYQDYDHDGYGDPESLDSSFDCDWSYKNRSVWWLDTADTFWYFQINNEGEDCNDTDSTISPDTGTCS